MKKFDLKSFAKSPSDEPSDNDSVSDDKNDDNHKEDKSSDKIKIAVDYALSGINKGNNSKWTISGRGILNPASYTGVSSVSGRAKAAAGGTINRGEGAVKFLRSLLQEANSVDKNFNPLFDVFNSVSDNQVDTSPPTEWVSEVLEGWELVTDYKSWYGKNSAYDFIEGRNDSLLDKFSLAWSNINRFKEADFFEYLYDLFSPSMGSLNTEYDKVVEFLESIRIWRAVLFAIKTVTDGSPLPTKVDNEKKDDSGQGSEDEDSFKIEDNYDISLSSVRSANDSASVDRATGNIMMSRRDFLDGKNITIVFYFAGSDSEKISNLNEESLMLFLKRYIKLEPEYKDSNIGRVIGVERKNENIKVYLEVDNKFATYIIKNSDDVASLFDIESDKDLIKVEASSLDIYNQIKKIAYSTTTSYYTVTSPSGKKVNLSIADMVMRKGYAAGSGNKFKARSLSDKVLKKKKKK